MLCFASQRRKKYMKVQRGQREYAGQQSPPMVGGQCTPAEHTGPSHRRPGFNSHVKPVATVDCSTEEAIAKAKLS